MSLAFKIDTPLKQELCSLMPADVVKIKGDLERKVSRHLMGNK